MTDSNRTRVALIEETTLGTTPAIQYSGTAWSTFQTARITGESINNEISNIVSNELRADRNVADLVQTSIRNGGGLNFELSFPQTRTFLGYVVSAALFTDWVNTPEKFNLTADSSITDAGTTSNTYVVDSGGASFVTGHLVRASGFTNSANNQLFRVTSSTSTTVVGTSLSLSAETAPPAGARLKVVGFEGASGDITATAGGLGSTTLNFTTLGLAVGQWIKVGGSSAGQQFATAVLNDWCRITAIAATALTLDNKPAGWTTDAGTSKTIRVWFGDYARNGTTRRSFSIEKGFLAQAVPSYLMFTGCVPASMSLSMEAQQIVTGSVDFMGTGASDSTSALGTAAAATTLGVMNAVANVGRIAEGGSVVTGPNYVRSMTVQVANNLREQYAIGSTSMIGVGAGRCEVSGSMSTYFGSNALYDKFIAGTATAMNVRVAKSNQAMIVTLPNIKFETARVVAQGGNQDVMAELQYRAILDSTTNCQIQIDRLEEYA